MNVKLKRFKNDFKRNSAGNIALILFMTLSVTLVVAASIIIVQLTSSIGEMYSIAQPPHFLQMHKGEIDQDEIDKFNRSFEGVKAWQTSPMINIYGDDIKVLGEKGFSLEDSKLGISLVKQNKEYDLLLDSDREIIDLKKGEIAIPNIILNSYNINIGDKVELTGNGIKEKFQVTSFVYDAQMNSTLVSSTRILLSEEDFDELFGKIGESEYLIESYFTDKSMATKFQTAYENSGLPQSGPAITYNQIILISAFVDILLAIIIILVSVLLIIVALISIKYTLMASLEEEIREIGTMKAIGMTYKDIRGLYLGKYKILIGLGVFLGYILALILSNIFTIHIDKTFGKQPFSIVTVGVSILSAILIYLISSYYCKKILKKIKSVTVVDALVLGKGFHKRSLVRDGLYKSKRMKMNSLLGIREILYNFKGFIIIFIAMFIIASIIVVPMNLLNTLGSKEFIPYMGSPVSDILIQIDSGENLETSYSDLVRFINRNKDIKEHQEIRRVRVETFNSDGGWMNLKIGSGEDSGKGLKYTDGKRPLKNDELAVSKLNADEMGVMRGDKVKLRFNEIEADFIISGIYQDLTSGGMTAKAINKFEALDAEKYEFIIELKDQVDIEEKAAQWSQELGKGYDIQAMDKFIDQTLGVVSRQIGLMVIVVVLIGIVMSGFIVVLFMKLRLAKDRGEIAGIKSIGFTDLDVRKQYLYKIGIISSLGIILGILVSNIVGEKIISLVFSIMGLGISKFIFIINPGIIFIALPLGLIICVLTMTWISTRGIDEYNIIALINE
nr:FtsX-like permease family protein [Tissierella sp.]